MCSRIIARWIAAPLWMLGAHGGTAEAQSRSCRFEPLTVSAVDGSQNRTYRATSGGWTIDLTNYAAPKPADTFSDPPLVVTYDGAGKPCSFEGGVWQADGFALDPNAAILLATEASGSTVHLTVYDLGVCKPVRSIKITEGVVSFANGGAQVGRGCSGHTVSTCKAVHPIAAGDICP